MKKKNHIEMSMMVFRDACLITSLVMWCAQCPQLPWLSLVGK